MTQYSFFGWTMYLKEHFIISWHIFLLFLNCTIDYYFQSWIKNKKKNLLFLSFWLYKWRVQMQKPLSAVWNFLLKLAFLSGSYIYF